MKPTYSKPEEILKRYDQSPDPGRRELVIRLLRELEASRKRAEVMEIEYEIQARYPVVEKI